MPLTERDFAPLLWREPLSVNAVSVIYANHLHEQVRIMDFIDDSVVSHPNPPGVRLPMQFDAAGRARIIAELKDGPVYPFPDVFGQPFHLPGSVRHDLNAISH